MVIYFQPQINRASKIIFFSLNRDIPEQKKVKEAELELQCEQLESVICELVTSWIVSLLNFLIQGFPYRKCCQSKWKKLEINMWPWKNWRNFISKRWDLAWMIQHLLYYFLLGQLLSLVITLIFYALLISVYL